MFIAMNRFKVKKGSEHDFEQVWMNRETYLERMPGFIEFHLLKGPEAEDHTLYSSHTVWASRAAFSVIIFFVLLALTLVTNRITKATERYDA